MIVFIVFLNITHHILKVLKILFQEFSGAIGVLSQIHTGIVVNKLLEFIGTELTKQPNKFLVLIRDKGNEVTRDKIRSSIAIIIPDIVKSGKLKSIIDSMYDIVILITQQISLTKVIYYFFIKCIKKKSIILFWIKKYCLTTINNCIYIFFIYRI